MNRSLILAAFGSVVSFGCVQEQSDSGADISSGGGEPGCFEQPPEVPPPGNPDFVGTVSGESMPGAGATRVVSANITRAANSTTCCQDFVVAGATNAVTVKFSKPYKGLTFLADRSDETVVIGSASRTVRDLAVADLNADNRNDIVVLRDDRVVVVALAVAAPPMNGPYFAGTSDVTMANGGYVAGTSLDLADMDGDGDLDLFVTSTSTRILWRKNNGNGVFAAASNSAAGLTTQNIVMAQVNAGASADALVSGSDGRFAYLRSTGNGFAAAQLHRVWGAGSTTTGMQIAAGRLCPGHATATSVAVAAFDIVKVACGDGTGAFANILEPHGTEEPFNGSVVDYVWDPSNGLQVDPRVKDMSVWTPPSGVSELYALSATVSADVHWLIPSSCEYKSAIRVPMAAFGWTGAAGMVVHREARGDTSWGGISCAGSLGLLSIH